MTDQAKPEWNYITPENAHLFEPKQDGDEYFKNGCWWPLDAKSFPRFDPQTIYRRRKPTQPRPEKMTSEHKLRQQGTTGGKPMTPIDLANKCAAEIWRTHCSDDTVVAQIILSHFGPELAAKAGQQVENLVMPEGLDFRNGGQHCDMLTGPCACGAWHRLDDLPYRIFNQLKAEKAQPDPTEAQEWTYREVIGKWFIECGGIKLFRVDDEASARTCVSKHNAELATLRREHTQAWTRAVNQIHDLRRELEQAKEHADQELRAYVETMAGLENTITDLRARLARAEKDKAEAEKDKARLDWLQDRFQNSSVHVSHELLGSHDWTDLRKAIDSARAQDKEGE